MKQFKSTWWLATRCFFLSMLAMYSGVQAFAADSGTINFTGTIVAGTCDLTAPPTVSLGDVDPSSLIGGHWKYVNLQPFTLTITNCVGVGGTNLTPGIQMTGQPSSDPGVEADNKWIFKTAGTAKGFGVALYAVSGNPKAGTDELPNNDWLKVTNYGKGTTLPTGGTQVNLQAAVACGRPAWCARKNLSAGTIDASLTFTFKYH